MLPAEITRLIGRTGENVLLEVEKGAIRKYSDAVGDPNPLYRDEEYARESRFGSMIAPPAFFGWPDAWGAAGPIYTPFLREIHDTISRLGYSRGLYGSFEMEFLRPVFAGDVISATTRIKDIQEREGRSGKMVFVLEETAYANQKGELVATELRTIIRR